MFPQEFKERIRNQSYLDTEGLLHSLDEPLPVSIRINNSKWNLIPETATPVPWCSSGWYLDKRPSFTSDPLFHSGCYYPQEASSMFIEQIFNQLFRDQNGIRVLDLCGAPGGKSTHLSSLIGGKGYLVANEVIKQRAGVLAENISKWGTANTIVTNNDPVSFGSLEGYFDLILVDAPCSGEGMFGDIRVRSEWSQGNADLCSERQKRIVMDAWPALKEDGILIYSTCTFNPSENEENIRWVSENTDSESVIIDISAFKEIQEVGFKGITGYGFYPGKIRGEGFFISVLRKSSSTTSTKRYPASKNKFQVTSANRKVAEQLLNKPVADLYRHDDTIYDLSLPVEEYLFLKDWLRIIRGGTALFKVRREDFTPLHDLALYSNLKKEAFPVVELDLKGAILFLKKENLKIESSAIGWILMTYLGVGIGFGKNIGSRVNNYFPPEWRIRMQEAGTTEKAPVTWLCS